MFKSLSSSVLLNILIGLWFWPSFVHLLQWIWFMYPGSIWSCLLEIASCLPELWLNRHQRKAPGAGRGLGVRGWEQLSGGGRGSKALMGSSYYIPLWDLSWFKAKWSEEVTWFVLGERIPMLSFFLILTISVYTFVGSQVARRALLNNYPVLPYGNLCKKVFR